MSWQQSLFVKMYFITQITKKATSINCHGTFRCCYLNSSKKSLSECFCYTLEAIVAKSENVLDSVRVSSRQFHWIQFQRSYETAFSLIVEYLLKLYVEHSFSMTTKTLLRETFINFFMLNLTRLLIHLILYLLDKYRSTKITIKTLKKYQWTLVLCLYCWFWISIYMPTCDIHKDNFINFITFFIQILYFFLSLIQVKMASQYSSILYNLL